MQVIVLLVLMAIPLLGAEDGWKRLQSGNLEVISNTSQDTSTRVLRQLARFRNAFEIQTGLTELSQAAIRVYLFRRSFDFTPFRDGEHVEGFYSPSRDRDLIVIHEGDDPVRVAFHEFTHLVLHRSGVRVPKWVDEGLSEYFSTAIVDGRKIVVGAPVPSHVTRLKAGAAKDDTVSFYAESWARIHQLASQRPYSERFPEWLLLVTTGVSPEDATRQIYSKPPDVAQYIANGLFSSRTLQVGGDDTTLESESAVPDSELMIVRLLIETGRLRQAEARLRKMPEALSAKAELAMAEGRNEEAMLLFERLLSRGRGTGENYYDYASLLYDSKAPVNDVITLLQKSIDLQSDWFPSRFLLGSIYAKEQRYGDAVPQLEAALGLHPYDKAVKQELEVARRKGVERTPSSTIRYPDRPKINTEELIGTLVQLDCLDNMARLVIQSEGKRRFLLVTDPSAVTLKGTGAANLEFSCGPTTPRKVRVLFKPGEDHVRGTAGEVTQIEFQ